MIFNSKWIELILHLKLVFNELKNFIMMERYPNPPVNLPNNSLLLEGFIKLMTNRVVLLLVTILSLFIAPVYAQESETNSKQIGSVQTQRIMHIDQFIASLRLTYRNSNSESLRVEDLIKNIQPAIYVSAIDVNTYGVSPVCLYTDIESLNTDRFSNLLRNDIEIVTIKIDSGQDLNSIIDISLFSIFPKLRYIYILSTIKITEDAIIRLVRNNSSDYNVFYNVLLNS